MLSILQFHLQEINVHLMDVQLDGKKTCSDTDLLRGLKNKFQHFEVTDD
jgi:glycerol-3-phosphate responsive antiterminator